jgi:hypothetical protein
METPQNKSDVTNKFLVGGLVIHFAGILHLSGSVQNLFKNFLFVHWLKFFQFFGANLTPKIFFANVETPKRHYLERLRRYGPEPSLLRPIFF